jgi:putative SOS response-associated peptidase YedK
MPVILREDAYHDWVNVDDVGAETAAALLVTYPSEGMYVYPVGRRVGNVANEGPSLLDPDPETHDSEPNRREDPTLF